LTTVEDIVGDDSASTAEGGQLRESGDGAFFSFFNQLTLGAAAGWFY